MFEHLAMLDFGDRPRVRTRSIAIDRQRPAARVNGRARPFAAEVRTLLQAWEFSAVR